MTWSISLLQLVGALILEGGKLEIELFRRSLLLATKGTNPLCHCLLPALRSCGAGIASYKTHCNNTKECNAHNSNNMQRCMYRLPCMPHNGKCTDAVANYTGMLTNF